MQDSAGFRIADAEVVVDGEARVRTDRAGVFEITRRSGGRMSLRTRKIGFFPDERDVRARAGETTRLTIVLTRRPVLLDTIAVAARAECSRFRFDGFVCRRRSARGVFLDVDAIDSINPTFTPGLLYGQPGFRVEAGRSGPIVAATSGWRCVVTLANGRPPSLPNPVPKWPNEVIGVEIYQHFDDVPEEYKHYAWIGRQGRQPPKRCSLINYWTQVRPRR